MENIYTIASSSSSTTYGNIMTFVKDQLTHSFPYDFFKDINLSSEIAYVNVRRRLGRNTIKELSVLERPFMSISPRIEVSNGDWFLQDVPLTKNYDNIEYGVERNTLFPLLRNENDRYLLTYKMNRDRITFDITITVDTLIQQLDLYKYLVNHFTWERPFAVKTSLEAMISREIIKQMGFLSNIDIDDKHSNQVPTMLQMLNRYAKFPITYKMRNGTSIDEFFMYYSPEVLLTFQDLSIEDVSRKNFADDFYLINFNCSAEFNLPGYFALIGLGQRPRAFSETVKVINKDGYHDLIPLFTIYNFYNRYPATRNGFLYHTSTRFQTNAGNKIKDVLDISTLFEDWKVGIIQRYNTTKIPMSTLLQVIVLKDGEELTENDWNVKWNSMELEMFHPDDNATYCLIIYANNILFTEERINDVEDKKIDKPNL